MSEVVATEPELPPVDATTAPWWEATREQRLLIQRCAACEHVQHYPRALCTGCGSTADLGWVEAAGDGVIDTFSVVHRALPGFEAPYVVARVRLSEGVVLLSNVVATDGGELDHDALRCDQPVTLRWRALSDGRHLPVFAPAEPSSADPVRRD